MEQFIYHPKGTCSTEMIFEIDDSGIIQDFCVKGGCNGNLKGISALIKGMKADDVADRLDGIKCGFKSTSCPDQIARALREYRKQKN